MSNATTTRPDEWVSECGAVRIIRADAMRLAEFVTEPVDALVTDPPYSSGGMVRGDRMQATVDKYQSTGTRRTFQSFTGDNRDQRGWTRWMTLWLSAARACSVPGAMACLFTDWRQLPSTTDAMQAAGYIWRGVVAWDKMQARPQPDRFKAQAEFLPWGTNGPRSFVMGPSTVYHDGVFRVPAPPVAERTHATQKPVDLMRPLVRTAPPGGLVLDPFVGSGTTAVAAIAEGRRFVGMELDDHFFDVAVERCRRAMADRPGR